MAVQEFINKLRLANKGKWYTWSGVVEGKSVEIKAHGTWLQIFRVNGLNHANCGDRKVGQFKEDLESGISYGS